MKNNYQTTSSIRSKKQISNRALLLVILIMSAFSLKAQVPSYVPTNGLVGWWPFNGNANDESGNGNNATVLNGTILTTDRFNNVNSSYDVDGINCTTAKGVSLPASVNNAGSYSISAWFQTTDSTKQYQCIFNSYPHQYIGVSHNYVSLNNTSAAIGNGAWLSVSVANWPT
jgi:hypothetical protein